MSYEKAKQCFRENVRLIASPQKDPIMWNLCTGLAQLVEELEQDIRILQRKIEAIDSDVKSMR